MRFLLLLSAFLTALASFAPGVRAPSGQVQIIAMADVVGERSVPASAQQRPTNTTGDPFASTATPIAPPLAAVPLYAGRLRV